jgi:predicted glycosyltransferase
MPHGALGELAEPLKALKRHYPETKVILGLRDILGAPDVIRKTWENEGAFEAAEEYYDSVCIYGTPDVYDVTSEYAFPDGVRRKADYCGYVAREASKKGNGKRPVNGAIAKYMPENDEKFIMVTGGGGADAAYFMDKFLESARLLKNDTKFSAIVSTGPFMHEKQFQYLRQKADGTTVRVTRIGADSIAIMRRADLVVSMAGYNTVSEIMRFRKNAIIVPRPGPSAEQTMRTKILSERGLFHSIHPNDLTADSLAGLVYERLQNPNGMDERKLPNLDGATKAASVVLNQAYATN